jgi:hypothetical protein
MTASDIAGDFIDPDRSLEQLANPNDKFAIPILGGHRAIDHVAPFVGKNRIFDGITASIGKIDVPYEDQCSAKYYADLVDALRNTHGEVDRVVEVGCYMGGSASIIAGCIPHMDFDFDIVDISANCLLFTYERIRRAFPEAVKRVRLFHGSLPQYTAKMIEAGNKDRILVHHDGAHSFPQVITDLGSLYFIRDRLHTIIVQDTHLRARPKSSTFVDMAVYAIFGTEVAYVPIGSAYHIYQSELMNPNQWGGHYFMPDVPEGIVIPLSQNSFKYPHPSFALDDFL